jgi:predicted Zn-dependent protease
MLTYDKALQINPNNFIVLNNLAYILMEAGRLDEASSYAVKAYELRPDSIPTVDTYAQILIRQNKAEESVELYQKVRANSTNSEEIYLNFVEALLMTGKKVIASRRIEERVFEEAKSKARLDELKSEYQL